MLPGCVAVLDVGKTLTKLDLVTEEGRLLAQRSYKNRTIESDGRRWLDTEGIDAWLRANLKELAKLRFPTAIVPVGHGAAAALVREGALACPVPDYEDAIDPTTRAAYELERDPFCMTGSPALPGGLNLGAQLYRLEREHPRLWENGTAIIPWPQFWAWKLCGIAATEVSSLGCHTDLWLPTEGRPSSIARRLGWADSFAPMRHAEHVLGPLAAAWAAATGLPKGTLVYCGAHDSNAALHAVRAYPTVAGREATVISTGTWFVAMRMPAAGEKIDLATLPESRDCLVNVDIAGRPVPSARFMGGRELDQLGGLDSVQASEALAALPGVLRSGAMVLPGGVPGVGPYPKAPGGWIAEPRSGAARVAAAALYAALMVDTSLDLIGSRGLLIVEGRFAASDLFIRCLATIRSHDQVFVNHGPGGGVTFGALRLVDDRLPAPGSLESVAPLDLDFSAYKFRWLVAVSSEESRP
jgi:sugar (pentulose or hexulose) kinase